MNNGLATLSATTTITGFESLAIAQPGDCMPIISPPPGSGPDYAAIPVMSEPGRWLAIALIALLGTLALRRRIA
jgi:hypothetical protein